MPVFASADPFQQQSSGMGQTMDMLQLVQQIQGMRRQMDQDKEVAQKKSSMEKALGMPFADIQANLAAMEYRNIESGMHADEARATSDAAYRGFLGKFGLTPEQVKANNDYSGMVSGMAGAQKATQSMANQPAEEQAARARVMGLHSTVGSLMSEIGGPASQLQQLAGGNTALGHLIGSAINMPPGAQVLQDALNLTPDVSTLPLPALQEHEARLTAAIQHSLAMQGEGRSQESSKRAGQQSRLALAPYEESLKRETSILSDLRKQRLAAQGRSLPAATSQELAAIDSRITEQQSRVDSVANLTAQAKVNLASGQQLPVLPKDIPAPSPIGQTPAIQPNGGLPQPGDESPLDMNRWMDAERQARKKLGRRADQQQVDNLAADLYMGRQ